MDINVRFAKSSDAEHISRIYSEWHEFKGLLDDDLIALGMETESEISQGMSSHNIIYLVAQAGDELVGACFIDTSYRRLKSIRIGNMMVKKTARNSGVGRELLKKVREYAMKNDIKKIWLWTQPELKETIRFYEKNGFVLEGTQKKQFCNRDALLFGLTV